MKKVFFLSTLLMGILWSCTTSPFEDNTIDSNDSNDSNENTDITYQQDDTITIDVWSHNGENLLDVKYADITLTDYEYSPFTGKLCFNINIVDSGYHTSEYWIIQRQKGSTRTDSQVSFKIDASEETLYHCESYSPDNEIVFGKMNSRDLNPTSSMDVLAQISVDDALHHLREYPEMGHIVNRDIISNPDNPRNLEEEIGSPHIVLDFLMNDPKRLRTGLYLEVYYRDFDLIYKTKEIEFTEDMYEDDQIALKEIIIDDLPPNVTFDVYFYFKGTDGVDEYDYTQFGYRTATSTTTGYHSMIKRAYPNLVADITGYEIGEETTTVSYTLENDGIVTVNGNPVNLELSVAEKDLAFSLDPDTTSIEIDNDLLDNHDYFQIVVKETNEVLCQYGLNYKLYNLFEFFQYNRSGEFKYSLSDYNVELISIDFDLRFAKDGPPVFSTTITEFPETYDITSHEVILVDAEGYDQYIYIDYIVTYRGLDGIETFERTAGKYVQN